MALLAPKRTLILGGGLAAVLVLYAMGAAKQPDQNTTSPTANASQCRVTVTADVLRVRSAPSGDAQVVARLSKGQQADAAKVVQNGFRKLADGQWVSADFIQPLAGRDCG
jgi:hypothetical protein